MSRCRGIVGAAMMMVSAYAGLSDAFAETVAVETVKASPVAEPLHLVKRISPGQSVMVNVDISSVKAKHLLAPLDLLLLIDNTGSMDSLIAKVGGELDSVAGAVYHHHPDARIAVALVNDYEGDGTATAHTPWQLVVDFTRDVSTLKSGFSGIKTVSGGDNPEAYLRGLYEASQLKWRSDAVKLVVFAGDATAHEPDPGPDGKLGTADDLTSASVQSLLHNKDIKVASIYSTDGAIIDAAAEAYFKNLAKASNGDYLTLADVSQIKDSILASVQRVQTVKLDVPPEYQDWLSASGDPAGVLLTALISPPYNAKRKTHDITLVTTGTEEKWAVAELTLIMGKPWGLLIPLCILLSPLLWLALRYVHNRSNTMLSLTGGAAVQAAVMAVAAAFYLGICILAWWGMNLPEMPIISPVLWF